MFHRPESAHMPCREATLLLHSWERLGEYEPIAAPSSHRESRKLKEVSEDHGLIVSRIIRQGQFNVVPTCIQGMKLHRGNKSCCARQASTIARSEFK